MIPLKDYRPSGSIPYVTIALIVINALVFLYQVTLSSNPSEVISFAEWGLHGCDTAGMPFTPRLISPRDLFVFRYGIVPCEVTTFTDLSPLISFPIILTLITSMFMHGGLLHLGGNMLYLWIFGDNVEDAMGHLRFLFFYLLCGVVAALAQIMINTHSPIPIIGASGAIAGVLGAYLMLYPYSRILTVAILFFFIRLIYLPAIVILGLWFLLQLFLSMGRAQGGVAYLAHIGGFVAGALLIYIFKKRYVQVQLFRRRYY